MSHKGSPSMLEAFCLCSRHQRPVGRLYSGSRHVYLALATLVAFYHFGSQRADAEPGRVEVGAKLAPSWETHNGDRRFAENTYKSGASFGMNIRYEFLDAWSLQGEVLHATRGSDVEAEGVSLGGFYFTYVELPALVRWRFLGGSDGGGRAALSGYLVGGPAVSILLGAEDGGDRQPIPRGDLSSFDISLVTGIGMVWEFTPRLAASLEARYDMGFINAFPEAMDGLETKNRAILLTLGIGYTINDSDSDGVVNPSDQCRTEPEDSNGYRDADGCPDADSDNDRILVGIDQCPEEAEDENGYRDEDGCPDGDSDDDKDGIPTRDDACPDQPFPYNKRLTHDRRGCPPKLERVYVGRREIEVTSPLEFEFAQNQLTPDHKKTLDQVVVLLRDYYPDMRLIVEGHADSKLVGRDRPEHNYLQSAERAEAVHRYLTANGIAEERLQMEARSNDNPKEIENVEGEQQSNRRVELIIIANPTPE